MQYIRIKKMLTVFNSWGPSFSGQIGPHIGCLMNEHENAKCWIKTLHSRQKLEFATETRENKFTI